LKNYSDKPVLEVDELEISFGMYCKGFIQGAVESVSLSVNRGEIVAVVGSSGSGKSLLAQAVLGILPKNAVSGGNIKYMGDILTPKLQKKLRGKDIVLIPQSVDYLDPLMKVGKQVRGIDGSKKREQILLDRYNLNDNIRKMYPFELSGGMARRVLISTALMGNPKLIVADEPTPGLSTDLAMETLSHFRELADNGTAVLLITHDIDLALEIADKIVVLYAGTTVEIALKRDFLQGYEFLRHPYTKALMNALPQNSFTPIKGSQPYPGNAPSGCTFADRCDAKTNDCLKQIPMRTLRDGKVRCINAT